MFLNCSYLRDVKLSRSRLKSTAVTTPPPMKPDSRQRKIKTFHIPVLSLLQENSTKNAVESQNVTLLMGPVSTYRQGSNIQMKATVLFPLNSHYTHTVQRVHLHKQAENHSCTGPRTSRFYYYFATRHLLRTEHRFTKINRETD